MPTSEKIQEGDTKQSGIEFKFPLLILRIRRLMWIYDRLGTSSVSRPLSWAALISMPIVACFGLYVIFFNLLTLLTMPAAREVGRQLGPQAYVLLPGVNPYLPIIYGWIGIVAAIAVHEGAHGVIARNLGFRVKSSGFLFLLAIPVGAFVDVDEKQMAKAKAKDSVRVLASGPGANVTVAIVSLLGVLIITSGLSPMVDGLYVFEVMEGMPAEDAGLLLGDVIIRIDDRLVINLEEFAAALEDKNPGDIVEVTVARGEMWKDRFSASVTLTEYEDRVILGVTLGELLIEQRLKTYQRLAIETPYIHFLWPTIAPGVLPFSGALNVFYTHPLGTHWHILANAFFWLWFVNVNVAIFNALPIHPLDGGRAFKSVLKSVLARKLDEAMISRLANAVTVTLISAVLMTIALPFIV